MVALKVGCFGGGKSGSGVESGIAGKARERSIFLSTFLDKSEQIAFEAKLEFLIEGYRH